jgi:hypothetical protein
MDKWQNTLMRKKCCMYPLVVLFDNLELTKFQNRVALVVVYKVESSH